MPFVKFPIFGLLILFWYVVYCRAEWKQVLTWRNWHLKLLKHTGAFLFCLFFVVFDIHLIAHLTLQEEVNSQVGFDYWTPREHEGEIFQIIEVMPGQIAEAAGLKVDDEIRLNSVDNLYHLIVYNQTRSVSIPIRRNLDCTQVEFYVPRLHLSVNPDRLFWTL